MEKKKILVQAYLAKNLGDDLFLKILFDRYKDVEWYLLGATDEYISIFNEYKNVYRYKDKYHQRVYSVLRNLRYKEFDAFINIGGSIFIENYYSKELIKNRNYIVNQFKKNNKSTFIIGSNFGPYKNEQFLLEYKELFKKFDDICFREEFSFNMFKEFDNIRYATDVIFNLKINEKNTIDKSIGISMIDILSREGLKPFKDKYEQKLIEIIEKYIKLDYKITMFSFCEKEGDEEAINRLLNNLDNEYASRIEIEKYNGDINKFINKFKSMDTIIGTRFHSIILALLFGQNLIPLVYSDKTVNVLNDLDLNKNYFYLNNLDDLNIENIMNIANLNKLKNNNIIKESEKQFLMLDKLIFNNCDIVGGEYEN